MMKNSQATLLPSRRGIFQTRRRGIYRGKHNVLNYLLILLLATVSACTTLTGKSQPEDFREENSLNQLLLHAAQTGDESRVKTLLAQGANATPQSADGIAPLLLAAGHGHIEVVKILLAHGAKVNIQTQDGFRPLGYAAREGHAEIVKILLVHGAEVNFQGSECASPLWLASAEGHSEIVKTLLDQGAEVNAQTYDGKTVLMAAIAEEHHEIARILLFHGAEINVQAAGHTPLTLAADRGSEQTVQALLAQGAEVNFQTGSGKTALGEAKSERIIEILKEAGATPPPVAEIPPISTQQWEEKLREIENDKSGQQSFEDIILVFGLDGIKTVEKLIINDQQFDKKEWLLQEYVMSQLLIEYYFYLTETVSENKHQILKKRKQYPIPLRIFAESWENLRDVARSFNLPDPGVMV